MEWHPEIKTTSAALLLAACMALMAVPAKADELPYQIAGPVGATASGTGNLPEVPKVFRNVTGIIETEFSRPHIPPLRLTRDGRLGLHSAQSEAQGPSLVLLTPEKTTQPFIKENRGESAIMNGFTTIDQKLLGAENGFQHITLCEGNPEEPGVKENPYTCGINGQDDCYDVTLVGGAKKPGLFSNSIKQVSDAASDAILPMTLVSAPVTVRISNPKTANAAIAEITVKTDQVHRNESLTSAQFEHVTPVDGRLLVVRLQGQKLTWFNENTNRYVTSGIDTAYSVAEPGAKPCDAANWTKFYPLSHAPYHATMKERYKFARYPFRDPMGYVIPDGGDIKGTYPWIDHKGRNLSLTVLNSRLYDQQGNSRYPTRCVLAGCDRGGQIDTNGSIHDVGYVVFGLWTHGKMVLLDGVLNDIDFKLTTNTAGQSYVSLYEPASGVRGDETGEVRMGSTRGSIPTGPSRTVNMTIFDSIEERLNYLPNMRTVTPHDVVWLASSGRQTDELSFDDALRPSGFIVSDMVGAVNYGAGTEQQMLYQDGWDKTSKTFSAPVMIQNSATAERTDWHVPTHGTLVNGRLEPAALGGVRGKGIWLDGVNRRLDYTITEQPRNVDAFPWFVSLFIEPRLTASGEVALIKFPDGSSLGLLNRSTVIYRNAQQQNVNQITLPTSVQNKQWTQIGLQIFPGGRRVQFFLNGYVLQDWTLPGTGTGLFRLIPGQLTLGSPAGNTQSHFRGWLDDFKIFSDQFNPEVACNTAYGTLIGLPDTYTGSWKSVANRYSAASHKAISTPLQIGGHATFPQYACYVDYSGDYQAHTANIPAGTTSVRNAINFPEGPLYHDAPRPDSAYNTFCLGCHTAGSEGGLGINALMLNAGVAGKYDPRRQPSQPPARIFGNIPASWFPGSPAVGFQTGSDGQWLDEWLMPSATGVTPRVNALVLVDARTGQDIFPLTDNMTIDLSSLPTDQVNIRASANGLTRNVLFNFDNQTSTQYSPFALFGTNEDTPESDFNAGQLTPGNHTLSAQAAGSSDPVLVHFTVAGALPTLNISTAANKAVVDRQQNLLQQFAFRARAFINSLLDFFSRIGTAITNVLADAVASDVPKSTPAAFSLSQSGLELFVDSAMLDRDKGTISIRGRAYGSAGSVLKINGIVVPVTGTRYTYTTTNLAVVDYHLQLENPAGGVEKTLVTFSQVRAPSALLVRESSQALTAKLLGSINISYDDITRSVNGALAGAIPKVKLSLFPGAELQVGTVTVSGLSVSVPASAPPDSSTDATLAAQLKNKLAFTGKLRLRLVCTRWGCLISMDRTIAFANVDMTTDIALALRKPKGEHMFDVGVRVAVDPDSIRVTSPLIPSLVYPFGGQLESAFNGFLFSLVNGVVSSVLTNEVSKATVDITDDTLITFGQNIPFEDYVQDNGFESLALLLPPGSLDAGKALLEGGLMVNARVSDARTNQGNVMLALDATVNSPTSDRQVYVGQRLTEAAFAESNAITLDTANALHPDLTQGFVSANGRLVASLLGTLTQSGTFDEAHDMDFARLIDVSKMLTHISSDPALANNTNVSSAVAKLLKNSDAANPGNLPVRLTMRTESAPYIVSASSATTTRVRFDNIVIDVNTILSPQDQLDGLTSISLLHAELGLLLDVPGDVESNLQGSDAIKVQGIRFHELGAQGLNMTPAARELLVRSVVEQMFLNRAERGFLWVKK